MGVTRKTSVELTPIRIEDGDAYNYRDYDLSESGDESDFNRRLSVEQITALRGKSSKVKGKKSRNLFDDLETGGVIVKKNMGSRKWRRIENARMLLRFTDLEDICEDGSDICETTHSAFEKLFENENNMKIWHEFIEKDEVEQRNILKNNRKTNEKQKQNESGWCVLGGKTVPIKKGYGDERKHHPAYSGKSCFDRLDRRSKGFLMGKKVNWALVDHLEKELRNLFCNCPETILSTEKDEIVFVSHFEAANDRLIAHIVSKYLWLNSQSVSDHKTNTRITEIRNPRSFFIPPHVTLIHYIEETLKKKLDFVPYSIRENIEKEFDTNNVALKNNLNFSSSSDSVNEWVKVEHESINL